MTAESRLPLKRVMLTDSDVYRQKPGGSPPHIFGPVTYKERSDVSNRIVSVKRHFKQDFVAYPDLPAVAKILLKEEALAKTHRPSSILEKAGCPIIGVGNSGELLVSVWETTLSALEHAVMTESSDLSVANISTIVSIEPFAIDDAQLAELETAATLKLRGGHTQIGILSVDGSGNLAESIGTSFASPSVAAILAHVQAAPSTEFSTS